MSKPPKVNATMLITIKTIAMICKAGGFYADYILEAIALFRNIINSRRDLWDVGMLLVKIAEASEDVHFLVRKYFPKVTDLVHNINELNIVGFSVIDALNTGIDDADDIRRFVWSRLSKREQTWPQGPGTRAA